MIVSATTPAETFLAWVTTATCLPQEDGQYHLMGSPLPCFHVQPLARSARSSSLYFIAFAMQNSLSGVDS